MERAPEPELEQSVFESQAPERELEHSVFESQAPEPELEPSQNPAGSEALAAVPRGSRQSMAVRELN